MPWTAPNKTIPCQTLFFPSALPPELRNVIYSYALASEPTEISTIHDAKQPSLLQLNQQIRHEAMGIYYFDRDFKIQVPNFGSRPLQLFWQHASYNLAYDAPIALLIVEEFSNPSWDNLIVWAKAFHEDKSLPVPRGGSYGSDARETLLRGVMRDVFETVNDFAHCEWEEVFVALQELRETPMRKFFKWGRGGGADLCRGIRSG